MTGPPDPAAVAAAERDHAARLYAHQATCPAALRILTCPRCGRESAEWPLARGDLCSPRDWAYCIRAVTDVNLAGFTPAGCATCASLAGHAERTARQAELLAPAQTPEMF